MSRHLRVLRKSGLIEDRHDEDDARIRIYQLRPDKFVRLVEWISGLEKFWGVQLQSLKAYSEGLAAENTD
jgi:DNA-binding transcriptional ArsR family regulator